MEEPRPTDPVSDQDRCPECGHEVAGAWLVCAWCGQQLAAPAELAAGARLADDRYEVLRVIGRGGFGITYDVGDGRLQRRVAMKELFPESAVRHGSMVLTPPQGRAGFHAARERFLREARVLARFTHPGIVRVYEVFEEHGTAYLVMELLEGRTLVELLHQRGEPFTEEQVLDVAGRVAGALRPVHVAGVLHRDVNPSNVMMTHHGRIVVIDFGLARDYQQNHTVGMTRMVTPGYAPLEQYRGEGRFGPSTDVYGLAATCYRLATGKVPVSALDRDGGAPLPSPRSLNPALSKAFSDAILDGLELEPSHRPQDLDAFLARVGVRWLPDTPRSLLLDAMPAPPSVVDPDLPAAVPAFGPPVPVAAAPAVADRSVPAEPILAATVARGAGESAFASPFDAELRHGIAELGAADDDRTADTVMVAPAARSVVGSAGPGNPPVDLTRPDDRSARLAAPPAAPPAWAPDAVPFAMDDDRHRSTSPPKGRRKLVAPAVAVALAWASAAPVLTTVVVVLVALPVLATIGDSAAHRLRARHGIPAGWAERRLAPGALAPVRFVRNLVVSIVRAAVLLVIGAILLGGWYGLEHLHTPQVLLDLCLRGIGVLVVGVILWTARIGSSRFRTGLGVDEVTERMVPDGRTSERVVIGWVVAVFLVAGALWLTPAPFPLP